MTQEEYNKVYELIKDIDWNNDDDKASENLFEKRYSKMLKRLIV